MEVNTVIISTEQYNQLMKYDELIRLNGEGVLKVSSFGARFISYNNSLELVMINPSDALKELTRIIEDRDKEIRELRDKFRDNHMDKVFSRKWWQL